MNTAAIPIISPPVIRQANTAECDVCGRRAPGLDVVEISCGGFDDAKFVAFVAACPDCIESGAAAAYGRSVR